MEILPGLHRIEADLQGRTLATYWIQGESKAILIDTGLDSHPEALLVPYLKRHSLALTALNEVYISHSDFDHFGGNRSLQKIAPQAIFYAHSNDLPEIVEPSLMIQRYRQFEEHDQIIESTEGYNFIRSATQAHHAVLPLKESRSISVAGEQWKILETPGHTQGHISFYNVENKTAIIQDAILGAGLVSSGGKPIFAPTYRSVSDYRKTLEKIKSLSLRMLLTSHYPVFQGKEVDDFIESSINFCDLLEKNILEVMSDHKRYAVKEFIQRLAPIMGCWEKSAWNTLAWPLVGHLEDLKKRKIITSELHEKTTFWVQL